MELILFGFIPEINGGSMGFISQTTAGYQQLTQWLSGLNTAELLGVIGFALSVIICLVQIIRWICALFRGNKSDINLKFKLEDVTYEVFKKKGYVTFDLYIQNAGVSSVEIQRAGFLLSDKTEKAFYQEEHELKTPDRSVLEPGQEAFFDDIDLFYVLNDKKINYKKIIGFFVDIKGKPRYYAQSEIHPVLNDQTIRSTLTDKKGMNGF